jgi:hypothetical protein
VEAGKRTSSKSNFGENKNQELKQGWPAQSEFTYFKEQWWPGTECTQPLQPQEPQSTDTNKDCPIIAKAKTTMVLDRERKWVNCSRQSPEVRETSTVREIFAERAEILPLAAAANLEIKRWERLPWIENWGWTYRNLLLSGQELIRVQNYSSPRLEISKCVKKGTEGRKLSRSTSKVILWIS